MASSHRHGQRHRAGRGRRRCVLARCIPGPPGAL